MKYSKLLLIFLLSFASVNADQRPVQPQIPTYAHRFNFEIMRLGYEHIKPDAVYVGIEGWCLWGLSDGLRLVLEEIEGRIGYNFDVGRVNTLTPFVGGGYFRCFHKYKQKIGFFSSGLRYEHIFGRTFNMGLNAEGMLGYSLNNERETWGDPIWGVDVGIPFTWRFTRKKNWDFRLEPFFTGWFGKNAEGLFGGFRSSIGYRF